MTDLEAQQYINIRTHKRVNSDRGFIRVYNDNDDYYNKICTGCNKPLMLHGALADKYWFTGKSICGCKPIDFKQLSKDLDFAKYLPDLFARFGGVKAP
jgi:hypothetical protein